MPNPIMPIRTLSILGAAYPHILNPVVLKLICCNFDRSVSSVTTVAKDGEPVISAPVPKVIFFKKFLLFDGIAIRL